MSLSSRPPTVRPRDLYKDGLNREHFLPFIDLIERALDVVPLNGPTDYRLGRIGGLATWHTPLGEAATAKVREAFFRLTDFAPEDAAHVPTAELAVGGNRVMHVPKSLKGVAVFSFKKKTVRRRSRCARLPRDCAGLSHGVSGRYTQDGAGQPQ